MRLIRQKLYSKPYHAYYVPFNNQKDHSLRYRQSSAEDRMVGPNKRWVDQERELSEAAESRKRAIEQEQNGGYYEE